MGLINVGKRIAQSKYVPSLGAAVVGGGFLAGANAADPLKPVSEFVQEELLGDPNAIQSLIAADVRTRVGDLFAGDAAQQRIQELRSPVAQPKRFAPPGSIVFGMWNSR